MVHLSQLQEAAVTAPVWDATHPSNEPVAVQDTADLDASQVQHIVGNFYREGYAIIQLEHRADDEGVLGELASRLDLGEPFVPPLYKNGRNADSSAAVTRISAALNAGHGDGRHPSFGTTNGQALHVDGTLQSIGMIKSTLLLCAQPAAEGGTSILFNSTGAYARLLAEDPTAALALAQDGVLVREASLAESQAHAGPAFGVADGRLVTRYAIGPMDHWEIPPGMDPDDLKRGTDFLLDMARANGPYYREFYLRCGQVLLLSNSQLSHGRSSYRDSPGVRRCLYRSLHLQLPKLMADATRRE